MISYGSETSPTDHIDKCNIKPGYRSDHSFIELIITLCKFERGRGLWKLNCSLLKDKEYLININNVIDREKLRYAVPIYNQDNITNLHDSCIEFTISDSDFLEILLLQIRGETVRYASALKKKDNSERGKLKTRDRKYGKTTRFYKPKTFGIEKTGIGKFT